MSSDSVAPSNLSGSSSWSSYFDARRGNGSSFFDRQTYISRLHELSPHLFSEATDVEFIESNRATDTPLKITIGNEARLSKQLEDVPSPALRIISLTQPFSRQPFSISESSASKIFTHHCIPPGFLDILCGFGDKEVCAEEGAPSGLYSSFNESNHDISYQFWYVEKNYRKHAEPWSTRQTAVYHRISNRHAKQAENLWVFAHPMPNSKAQTRLAVATKDLTAKQMTINPLRLHVWVWSCYIDNWRWYLHDMKRQYVILETTITTASLEDTLKDDRGLNFDTLQTIRDLEARLIPIPNMMQSSLPTLSAIQDMNDKLGNDVEYAETSYHLASCISRLKSYCATAENLQKRVENMTKLLADALNIKNQEIAQVNQKIAARHQEIAAANQKIAVESNEALVKLTRDTVDDSLAVRTITLITLFYLPASFVSGLFGINLFKFDDSWAFDMSPQIWIYVVAVVIVIIITYSAWKTSVYYQRKEKKRKEREEAARMKYSA